MKKAEKKTKHFVYVLRCADDSLYTGYATNVERRVREHNGKEKRLGAKYTAGRRPVALAYTECCNTRSEALQREAAIKQLRRKEKELLIKTNTQVPPAKNKKQAL